MPIFEYRCNDCRHQFERIVFTREAEAESCPLCQSRRIDKLLSSFAVSGGGVSGGEREAGPCPCGAPRRGMCGEN